MNLEIKVSSDGNCTLHRWRRCTLHLAHLSFCTGEKLKSKKRHIRNQRLYALLSHLKC